MTALRQVSIGDELEPWSDGPLRVADFVAYQGASGDLNPVHYDAQYAQAAGFPGPFAVGMRQAGVAGSWLVSHFGVTAVRALRVRWREQAWPDDVLTYAGEVTAVRDVLGVREVDVEFTVTRQTGGVHLSGSATITEDAD